MVAVYIETSIVSHVTARNSSEISVAMLQDQAREWWRQERPKFELVTSQLVINEASAGDPIAARERLSLLAGIRLVPISSEVQSIATALISSSMLPPKAAADALHVAAAAFAGVDYVNTELQTYRECSSSAKDLCNAEITGVRRHVNLHTC